MKSFNFTFLILLFALTATTQTTPKQKIAVIGYYAGNAESVNAYPVEKLTHIIFSFCHLKGNELRVDNLKDTLTIKKLVSLSVLQQEDSHNLSLSQSSGIK